MPNIVTAFELTPADCKVVQLIRQKTVQLRRALLIPLPASVENGDSAVAAKGHAIREALRLHKIQPLNPILIIPKHSVTVRTVFLPSVEDAELAGMANFEAQKIIPFNAERHVISHSIMKKESITGSRVLIAAVDEPIISESVSILLEAGIDPVVADVSCVALANAWRREHSKPPEGLCALVNIGSVHTDITLLNQGMPVVARSALHGTGGLLDRLQSVLHSPRRLEILDLVNLDVRDPDLFQPSAQAPTSPNIAGAPAHAPNSAAGKTSPPSAPGGSAGAAPSSGSKPSATADAASAAPSPAVVHDAATDPGEAAAIQPPESGPQSGQEDGVGSAVREWVEKLLKEIRLTYDFARRGTEIGQLQHIFISGDGALIRGLDQHITVTLGAEVEPFAPLFSIPTASKQAALDERLLPLFSVAAGGAFQPLWPESYAVNLLPPSVVLRQERQAMRLSLMLLGAMFLIAGALIFLYVSSRSAWQREALRRYNEYNQELRPQVKQLQDKERKVQILRRIQRDRASALAILDAISAYSKIGSVDYNGEIVLQKFNYALGDEVTIDGHAVNLKAIHDLLSYLEQFSIDNKKVFRQVKVEDHRWDSALSGRPQVLSYTIKCYLREGEKGGSAE